MKKNNAIYPEKLIRVYRIITLVKEHKMKQRQAAKELNLSVRQIRRLVRRFKQSKGCIDSLRYKRNHPAWNSIPAPIRDKVAKLKEQRKKRSCQHIAELLPKHLTKEEKKLLGQRETIHLSTIRRILIEKDQYSKSYTKSEPANRFEMSSFGELAQMDTHHIRRWPDFDRIYLIMVIDDYSRMILAGRFFSSDSTYNNMLVLKEAIKKYGLFQMLYTDNSSIFNYTLHTKFSHRVIKGQMEFYPYHANSQQVKTDVEIALLELGIPMISHAIGNPKAKGKIERLFRFIEGRFVKEQRYQVKSLDELNRNFQIWIRWYNHCWINRNTGVPPIKRLKPSVFKPLPKDINLDDIFCLKDERKVAKDNSFSYDGSTYTINHKYNMVAYTVELHIHPMRKIRVWHDNKFIQEFKYKRKPQF